ncbi:MAG: asparaginase [Candidatus Binataceae bacterium]
MKQSELMSGKAASKIVLVTTGGRISTKNLGGDGVVPRMSGRDLLKEIGALKIPPEVIEFDQIPGCEMAPDRMAGLANIVATQAARDDVAGVVVTHGADTLAESSFFCHLTVGGDKPVVFTESMRASSDPSWDGPANLRGALAVAQWSRASGLGALVVCNDEIHSARFVIPTHTTTLNAFQSPTCGPLGRLYYGLPVLFVKPVLNRTVLAPKIDVRVSGIVADSGIDPRVLEMTLDQDDLHGLVIAGFGSGRAPLLWVEPLSAAAKRGLPIVLCSRVGVGPIGDRYAIQGADYLRRQGLIAAPEMSVHKARVKLMIALGNGLSGGSLKDYFESE